MRNCAGYYRDIIKARNDKVHFVFECVDPREPSQRRCRSLARRFQADLGFRAQGVAD
jgi:hypothetical protein